MTAEAIDPAAWFIRKRPSDDDDHAFIDIVPGTMEMWNQPGDPYGERLEALQPLAWHQGSLLARLILALADEIELERIMHGCISRRWAIVSTEGGYLRRPTKGDRIADGEVAHPYYDDGCTVGELWEDQGFYDAQFTVPRRRVRHWTARISSVLTELMADVPTTDDLATWSRTP